MLQGENIQDNTIYQLILEKWREVSSSCAPKTPNPFRSIDKNPGKNPFPNDGKFRMFWYDVILERDWTNQELYLIGKSYNAKANTFENCCLKISEPYEKFYLLHQNEIDGKANTLKDILREFRVAYAPHFRIRQFDWQTVIKRYAFDPTVNFEDRYVEIKTTSRTDDLRSVPGFTFQKMLGVKTSFIEVFLTERQINGPCWLEVQNVGRMKRKMSKLDVEVSCKDINEISVCNYQDLLPKFSICVINMKTIYNELTEMDEIVLISILFQRRFDLRDQEINLEQHHCIIQSGSGLLPELDEEKLEHFQTTVIPKSSEEGLLEFFVARLYHLNPDIVLFYDLGNAMDLLHSRIMKYKLQPPLRLNFFKASAKNGIFQGRLRLILQTLASEMVKSWTYSLDELTRDILNVPLINVDETLIKNSFKNYEKLDEMITSTMYETYCTFQLAVKLNVLPFTMEITKVCGNFWNLTLNGSVSDRCEYLLLHAFYQENFILPNKIFGKYDGSRDDSDSITGGLVLQPKVALYDNFVVAVDFNALYPNIIREFNLCLSTFLLDKTGTNVFEYRAHEIGVIPKLMTKLLDLRKRMKLDKGNKIQVEVLKKITNSVFGYLAYPKSRFYAKEIAAEITKRGREILMKTVDIISSMRYKVIYGDTDSVMFVVTEEKYEDVLKVTNNIIQTINKDYKFVNLDLAAVMKPFVIFNKKKYAGVEYFEESNVIKRRNVFKGLEIVRRDWSGAGRKAGELILTALLDNPGKLDINEIYDIIKKFRRDVDNLNVDDFVICQRMTQDLQSYKDQSHPHVSVALSEYCRERRQFKKNDIVSYIICEDQSNIPICKRARHVDEVKMKKLTIDKAYYLSNQIFPIVKRILCVLNNFNEKKLKDILLVETKRKAKLDSLDDVKVEPLKDRLPEKNDNISENFYIVICPSCNVEFKAAWNSMDFIYNCPNKCHVKYKCIANYLYSIIRKLLYKHLFGPYVCENVACKYESFSIGLDTKDVNFPLCPRCETNRMKERDLDIFPKILTDMWNSSKADGRVRLANIIVNFLDVYAYEVVDLGTLFDKIVKIKN